jgi:hypothetical protein
MADVSDGPNARARDENIGETAPGLPDEAVVEGELAPGELGVDAERDAERLRRSGWTAPPRDG